MKLKYSKIALAILSSASMVMLSSCAIKHPVNVQQNIVQTLRNDIGSNQALIKKQNLNLPSSVEKALSPDMGVKLATSSTASVNYFDVSVNNIPAKTFFMSLVAGTPYNVLVDPKVKGKVSLKLKHVTVPQVIDSVCDLYGFQYKLSAHGYVIQPKHLITRIFTVNYLDVSRTGESSTSTTNLSSDGEGGGKVTTNSESNFWESLQTALDKIVGSEDGKYVSIDPGTGMVTVKGYPKDIKEVSKFLDNAQDIASREVMLEAKILEVSLSANYSAGIKWKVLGLNYNMLPQNIAQQEGTVSMIDYSAGEASAGDFARVIRLLNAQGKVQVLSSPRVSALNNQRAIIKVGGDRYYITGVTNSIVYGGTEEQTESSDTQNIELKSFFSGIALDVTPQIAKNGLVVLHIHPTISKVTQTKETMIIGGKNQEIPVAVSNTREADTVIKAKDNEMVIIGGLMEDQNEDETGNVPGLSKTPLGFLFHEANNEATKTELVILLKPTIIHDNQSTKIWTHEMQLAQKRFEELKPEFKYEWIKHPEYLKKKAAEKKAKEEAMAKKAAKLAKPAKDVAVKSTKNTKETKK